MKQSGTFLPLETLTDFSKMFKSESEYLRIMGDLCTLREYLSQFIEFTDSPLFGQTEHPIFKMTSTLNEIIGTLLISGYHLSREYREQGKTISLIRYEDIV